MSKREYATQQDVYMRLHDTICFYDNKPVYVTVNPDEGNGLINLSNIHPSFGKIKLEVSYTDDLFDSDPRELGFVNRSEDSYFLIRDPMRRQKQGISTANIRMYQASSICKVSSPYVNDIVFSREFVDMLNSKYVSLEKAFKNVSEGVTKAQAFHINAAIILLDIGIYGLMFRNRLVAIWNGSNFTIPDSLGDRKTIEFSLKRCGISI